MNRRSLIIGVSIGIISILVISSLISGNGQLREGSDVNPDNINQFMQEQVDIGPRYPGSNGSLDFKDWVLNKIQDPWSIEIQSFLHQGVEIRNYFITHKDLQDWPSYLFGAHYDSRKYATSDPENPQAPVPGANDGASGVAVILEMLVHVPADYQEHTGFILFDAEDQGAGGIPGWDWIVGSEYFADQMTQAQIDQTEFFLLYDMVANDELVLRKEGNSDSQLNDQIWSKATDLGYGDIFKDLSTGPIKDDHLPFKNLNIPVVDLIDLSYPEWHTTQDNMENVSAENAAIVLDVVLEWMRQYHWVGKPGTTKSNQETANTNESPVQFYGFVLSLIIIIKKRKYS